MTLIFSAALFCVSLIDVPPTDTYQQQIDHYATEMLPPPPAPHLPPKTHYQTPQPAQTQNQPRYENQSQPRYENQNQPRYENQIQPRYNETQNQPRYNETQNQPRYNETQNQPRYETQNQPRYETQNQPRYDYNRQADQYQYEYQYQYQPGQKIGRIQDYDPVSDGPRAPPNTQRASATLIYNSTSDGKRGSHQVQQQQRQIGRVTDLDPLASEQPRPVANHTQPVQQRVYIAMYDYEANDSDEVSFREGDYISNVTSIDEGWMTGRVMRTGRTGMLPANYVELQPQP